MKIVSILCDVNFIFVATVSELSEQNRPLISF
jgi:hypothetical protein